MQVFQRKDSMPSDSNIQGSQSFSLTKGMMMMSTESDIQLQDQDSSSTQSSGESGGGREVASFGEHTNLSGYIKNQGNALESYTTTSLMVSQDSVFPPPASGLVSWPPQCPETPHLNGFLPAEYASQPMALTHLEMMSAIAS
ncbi:hypothetical protein HA466_0141480 [Hirschfeldia incana]|nr:hypothetical protein HA466_0141480 [Hirschfeldia incana]